MKNELKDIDSKELDAVWRLVCSYVQNLGHPRWEAEDITQDLFHQLLRMDALDDIMIGSESEEHRKSRLFLSAKRVAINWYRRGRTQRRCGDYEDASIDDTSLGEKMAPVTRRSPASEAMLHETEAAIVAEVESITGAHRGPAGSKVAAVAKEYLLPDSASRPYKAAAAEMQLTPTNLRVIVHRLRGQLRNALMAEDALSLAS